MLKAELERHFGTRILPCVARMMMEGYWPTQPEEGVGLPGLVT